MLDDLLESDQDLRLRLAQALLKGFSADLSLEYLADYGLNTKLGGIVSKEKNDGERARALVDWTINEGRSEDLVRAALKFKARNPYIKAIALELAVSSVEPAMGEFEKLVIQAVAFGDPATHRAEMRRCERAVCALEFAPPPPAGRVWGTGFLVGPEVVMTNWHVVERLLADRSLRDCLTFKFDFEYAADGVTLLPITPVTLAEGDDWLVASSPEDQLDYALLRVAGRPGVQSVKVDPGEPKRGWLELTAGYALTPGEPLIILQHPQLEDGEPNEPLKITSGSVVSKVGDFVYYTANTRRGSSGSPCFQSSWKVVALHHYSTKGPANQGVDIGAIRGHLHALGALGKLDSVSNI